MFCLISRLLLAFCFAGPAGSRRKMTAMIYCCTVSSHALARAQRNEHVELYVCMGSDKGRGTAPDIPNWKLDSGKMASMYCAKNMEMMDHNNEGPGLATLGLATWAVVFLVLSKLSYMPMLVFVLHKRVDGNMSVFRVFGCALCGS